MSNQGGRSLFDAAYRSGQEQRALGAFQMNYAFAKNGRAIGNQMRAQKLQQSELELQRDRLQQQQEQQLMQLQMQQQEMAMQDANMRADNKRADDQNKYNKDQDTLKNNRQTQIDERDKANIDADNERANQQLAVQQEQLALARAREQREAQEAQQRQQNEALKHQEAELRREELKRRIKRETGLDMAGQLAKIDPPTTEDGIYDLMFEMTNDPKFKAEANKIRETKLRNDEKAAAIAERDAAKREAEALKLQLFERRLDQMEEQFKSKMKQQDRQFDTRRSDMAWSKALKTAGFEDVTELTPAQDEQLKKLAEQFYKEMQQNDKNINQAGLAPRKPLLGRPQQGMGGPGGNVPGAMGGAGGGAVPLSEDESLGTDEQPGFKKPIQFTPKERKLYEEQLARGANTPHPDIKGLFEQIRQADKESKDQLKEIKDKFQILNRIRERMSHTKEATFTTDDVKILTTLANRSPNEAVRNSAIKMLEEVNERGLFAKAKDKEKKITLNNSINEFLSGKLNTNELKDIMMAINPSISEQDVDMHIGILEPHHRDSGRVDPDDLTNNLIPAIVTAIITGGAGLSAGAAALRTPAGFTAARLGGLGAAFAKDVATGNPIENSLGNVGGKAADAAEYLYDATGKPYARRAANDAVGAALDAARNKGKDKQSLKDMMTGLPIDDVNKILGSAPKGKPLKDHFSQSIEEMMARDQLAQDLRAANASPRLNTQAGTLTDQLKAIPNQDETIVELKRQALNYIRMGKNDEAKKIINNLLERNPADQYFGHGPNTVTLPEGQKPYTPGSGHADAPYVKPKVDPYKLPSGSGDLSKGKSTTIIDPFATKPKVDPYKLPSGSGDLSKGKSTTIINPFETKPKVDHYKLPSGSGDLSKGTIAIDAAGDLAPKPKYVNPEALPNGSGDLSKTPNTPLVDAGHLAQNTKAVAEELKSVNHSVVDSLGSGDPAKLAAWKANFNKQTGSVIARLPLTAAGNAMAAIGAYSNDEDQSDIPHLALAVASSLYGLKGGGALVRGMMRGGEAFEKLNEKVIGAFNQLSKWTDNKLNINHTKEYLQHNHNMRKKYYEGVEEIKRVLSVVNHPSYTETVIANLNDRLKRAVNNEDKFKIIDDKLSELHTRHMDKLRANKQPASPKPYSWLTDPERTKRMTGQRGSTFIPGFSDFGDVAKRFADAGQKFFMGHKPKIETTLATNFEKGGVPVPKVEIDTKEIAEELKNTGLKYFGLQSVPNQLPGIYRQVQPAAEAMVQEKNRLKQLVHENLLSGLSQADQMAVSLYRDGAITANGAPTVRGRNVYGIKDNLPVPGNIQAVNVGLSRFFDYMKKMSGTKSTIQDYIPYFDTDETVRVFGKGFFDRDPQTVLTRFLNARKNNKLNPDISLTDVLNSYINGITRVSYLGDSMEQLNKVKKNAPANVLKYIDGWQDTVIGKVEPSAIANFLRGNIQNGTLMFNVKNAVDNLTNIIRTNIPELKGDILPGLKALFDKDAWDAAEKAGLYQKSKDLKYFHGLPGRSSALGKSIESSLGMKLPNLNKSLATIRDVWEPIQRIGHMASRDTQAISSMTMFHGTIAKSRAAGKTMEEAIKDGIVAVGKTQHTGLFSKSPTMVNHPYMDVLTNYPLQQTMHALDKGRNVMKDPSGMALYLGANAAMLLFATQVLNQGSDRWWTGAMPAFDERSPTGPIIDMFKDLLAKDWDSFKGKAGVFFPAYTQMNRIYKNWGLLKNGERRESDRSLMLDMMRAFGPEDKSPDELVEPNVSKFDALQRMAGYETAPAESTRLLQNAIHDAFKKKEKYNKLGHDEIPKDEMPEQVPQIPLMGTPTKFDKAKYPSDVEKMTQPFHMRYRREHQ